MGKLVGACGAICSDCDSYEVSCDGCYKIEGKASWLHDVNLEVCDFYECAVEEKNLQHCGECNQIPCVKFFKNINPSQSKEEHYKVVKERTFMLKRMKGRTYDY